METEKGNAARYGHVNCGETVESSTGSSVTAPVMKLIPKRSRIAKDFEERWINGAEELEKGRGEGWLDRGGENCFCLSIVIYAAGKS